MGTKLEKYLALAFLLGAVGLLGLGCDDAVDDDDVGDDDDDVGDDDTSGGDPTFPDTSYATNWTVSNFQLLADDCQYLVDLSSDRIGDEPYSISVMGPAEEEGPLRLEWMRISEGLGVLGCTVDDANQTFSCELDPPKDAETEEELLLVEGEVFGEDAVYTTILFTGSGTGSYSDPQHLTVEWTNTVDCIDNCGALYEASSWYSNGYPVAFPCTVTVSLDASVPE